MVHKKNGRLEIVTKGSKKYSRLRHTCRSYKENLNRKILEKEVIETNKLLYD